MNSVTDPPLTVLDQDGELFLTVGVSPDHSRFHVCPAAMRRASPVWKAMLFGGWAESRPATATEQWNVSLPDDSPKALRALLAIIHGRFDLHPLSERRVTHQVLYEIVTTVDKYDLFQTIQPWVNLWMELAESDKMAPESSLYVAWELGNDVLFRRRAKQICLELSPRGAINLSSIDHLGPEDFVGKEPTTYLLTVLPRGWRFHSLEWGPEAATQPAGIKASLPQTFSCFLYNTIQPTFEAFVVQVFRLLTFRAHANRFNDNISIYYHTRYPRLGQQ